MGTTRRAPGHPAARETRLFSQNGEDGIIAAILERLGIAGGVFAEIGAGDGRENCTRALAETGHWRGVWIEGDPDRATQADAIARSLGITTVAAFVDRVNVAALIAESAVADSRGLDVLVIDVDGNDWYLWRELACHYRPALVVTEINGALGPWLDWVMPYDATHIWHEDRYHGATLRAFARLARSIGYVLVACDGNGVNAFWVRADLAFGFPAAGRVRRQYAPPSHAPPTGHPWWVTPPIDCAPLDTTELGALELHRPEFVRAPKPGRANAIVVDVFNGSSLPIASGRRNPIRVAAWWGQQPSPAAWTEPVRGALSGIIESGHTGTAVVVLGPQTEQFLTLDIVQEGIAWAHAAPNWECPQIAVPRSHHR